MRLSARLLLAAALGCARAPAPAPAPATLAAPAPRPATALDDMLMTDLADDQAFPWSAARRLNWRDFEGSPPAAGSEAAKSAYTLYYVWRCRGQVFDFRVVAAFRPRQSWVKAIVLTDTTQRRTILSHEQTHFDLAEVHARNMRRVFEGLAAPCRKSDAELSALAQRLVQEEKAEQRRYDAETNHGLLAAQQAAWGAAVARRLAGRS